MPKYETYEPVSNFVDTLSCNFLSPLILLTTRISNSSSTLIDKIFCNITFTSDIISGNLTPTAFYHHPQIAIIKDFFKYSLKSKSNIYKRNLKKFDQNQFI